MRASRSTALLNRGTAMLTGLLLVLTTAHTLTAAPLKLDDCLSRWRNSTSPEAAKIESLMAEGAVGARQRLSADQLTQIKKHIEAIEQLKFRCRLFVPPPPGAGAP